MTPSFPYISLSYRSIGSTHPLLPVPLVTPPYLRKPFSLIFTVSTPQSPLLSPSAISLSFRPPPHPSGIKQLDSLLSTNSSSAVGATQCPPGDDDDDDAVGLAGESVLPLATAMQQRAPRNLAHSFTVVRHLLTSLSVLGEQKGSHAGRIFRSM